MTDIDDLVSQIRDFSKTKFTGSESNTKTWIIEPLLKFLGWKLPSSEVQLEYPVKIGTSETWVDYALKLEDKPVVLVEAKAFDEVLAEKHSSQIISYGRVEDVKWVTLTNGKLLKLFDTKAGKTEKECLVAEIDLEKLPQQANELKLLSRESILTGEIEKIARRLTITKVAVQNLRQRQEEIVQALNKMLLKITGPELKNRVQIISSQLAKQAVELFEEKVEGPPGHKPSDEGKVIKIPSISRRDLSNKTPGEVILCPSRVEGVDFLRKYNAWGFVNVGKAHKPEYFALYVAKPQSSVAYFAEIDSITEPLESKHDISNIREEDLKTFEMGKRVIHLKPGSLVELKDHIPLRNHKLAPRALRYSTLEKLVKAKCVEEL